MIHLIKEILEVQPYKIKLKFNTGDIRLLDLERCIQNRSFSPGSKYIELLNPQYFKSVKMYPEWETIYWDNEIDFCPDILFSESQPVVN